MKDAHSNCYLLLELWKLSRCVNANRNPQVQWGQQQNELEFNYLLLDVLHDA